MPETMALEAQKTKIKRDPAGTKERILRASLVEFGSKGYGGARTAGIAKRARCNIRMLYHYFGSKEDLYIACLERVYSHIRAEERTLRLLQLEPRAAIEQLVCFTFDHMHRNPDFVHIAGVENTQRGRFIKKLPLLANAAGELIETIREILRRGAKERSLRGDIDAFQLYLSILSLSYLHLSNRYTLSVTYGRDMAESDWLDERRRHVCDMVLSYVRATD